MPCHFVPERSGRHAAAPLHIDPWEALLVAIHPRNPAVYHDDDGERAAVMLDHGACHGPAGDIEETGEADDVADLRIADCAQLCFEHRRRHQQLGGEAVGLSFHAAVAILLVGIEKAQVVGRAE